MDLPANCIILELEEILDVMCGVTGSLMWSTEHGRLVRARGGACLCKSSSCERMLEQKRPCCKGTFCTEEVARWETPCFPASAHIIYNRLS